MTEEPPEALSRRTLLRATAGGAVAGAANATSAQDGTETPTGTPTQEGTPTDGGDGGGGGGGATWTVTMNDNNEFVPDQRSVRPGDTIVRENVGSVDHTATAYRTTSLMTPTPSPEPADPALPPTTKAVGVAAASAMAPVLGLAYLFIEYGGPT